MEAEQIIRYIQTAEKKTPVKVYFNSVHSCYGNFERDDFGTSVPFDIEFCFSFIAG